MGKGTEVGKHETWVEINEESGSSGKKRVSWGVVAMSWKVGRNATFSRLGLRPQQ